MNADQKDALAALAGQLGGVASALRAILTAPDASAFDGRERDGITVLSTEIDAIVEGIGNLCRVSASS